MSSLPWSYIIKDRLSHDLAHLLPILSNFCNPGRFLSTVNLYLSAVEQGLSANHNIRNLSKSFK